MSTVDDFNQLKSSVEDCLTRNELRITDKDDSIPHGGCWMVQTSKTTACSISLMHNPNHGGVVVIQSCFSNGSPKLLKGPMMAHLGGFDVCAQWVNSTIMPFTNMIQSFERSVSCLERQLRGFQYGTLVDHTMVNGITDVSSIEHYFHVRMAINSKILDLVFSAVLNASGMTIVYSINKMPVMQVYSGTTGVDVDQCIARALSGIEHRFFVDPDIYDEIRLMPGLWGHNVIALTQNQNKTAHRNK